MALPNSLQTAIETLTSCSSLSSLMQATQEVSSRYRNPDSVKQAPFLISDAHRVAYLSTRLPATFEAVRATLAELRLRAPNMLPTSLCDIGAGPGTGMWAVVDVFPSVERVTLFEQDSAFLALGKQLAGYASDNAISSAHWLQGDMTTMVDWPSHDLLLLSYSIGEIDNGCVEEIVKRCWKAAQQGVIIVEPGTPRGFQKILQARQILIECGASIVAPCPHANRCPMESTKNWCHFPARVTRSSAHRQIKEGSLGYEDEKYSYVIATKAIGASAEDRVVGHPSRRSGHVHIELCTSSEGIQKKVISKKQGDAYRWARKAEWGDGR